MLVMRDHYTCTCSTLHLMCVITSRRNWRAAAETTKQAAWIRHVCMKCVCVCVCVCVHMHIQVHMCVSELALNIGVVY